MGIEDIIFRDVQDGDKLMGVSFWCEFFLLETFMTIYMIYLIFLGDSPWEDFGLGK